MRRCCERPAPPRRWRPRASRGTRQPRAPGPSPRIPCRRPSRGRTRASSAARVPRDRSTTRLARAEDRSRAPPSSPPDVPPASRRGPACRRRGARTRALAKGRPRSSPSRCISDERRGFDAARGRVKGRGGSDFRDWRSKLCSPRSETGSGRAPPGRRASSPCGRGESPFAPAFTARAGSWADTEATRVLRPSE